MKNLSTHSTIKIITFALLATGLTACSDVSFSPTPVDLTQKEEPQPTPPPVDNKLSETFYFNAAEQRPVDILFVIDNSSSMLPEQKKLGQRLSSFISVLNRVDWQIGITTTDVSSSAYGLRGDLLTLSGTTKKVLRPTDPSYETIFLNSVVRQETLTCDETGNCPSNNEQPLLATMMAIERRNGSNAGFFRDGADLAVVVLSDEDEFSNGPANATKPEAVINYFRSVWGTSKKLSVYGIIIEPDDTACKSKQGLLGAYGTHVAALATLTGGMTGSICDDDYSLNLSKIGEKVSNMVNHIVLKNEPEKAGMSLEISPADPGLKWSIDGKRITFSKAPREGTRVDVVYDKKSTTP